MHASCRDGRNHTFIDKEARTCFTQRGKCADMNMMVLDDRLV